MEIAIAVFIGVWFTLASALAVGMVFHDFKSKTDDTKEEDE